MPPAADLDAAYRRPGSVAALSSKDPELDTMLVSPCSSPKFISSYIPAKPTATASIAAERHRRSSQNYNSSNHPPARTRAPSSTVVTSSASITVPAFSLPPSLTQPPAPNDRAVSTPPPPAPSEQLTPRHEIESVSPVSPVLPLPEQHRPQRPAHPPKSESFGSRAPAVRYAPKRRVDVVPILRKNQGVRARKAVRARDIIFIEYPLVQVRAPASPAEDAEQLLFHALHQLPTPRLAAFWGLFNKHGLWSYHPRPETRAQGIWDSNVVKRYTDTANGQMAVTDDEAEIGPGFLGEGDGFCFETASRVNHDCWPNAEFELRHDSRGRTYARVVALSDIRMGDEVTFCYLGRREEIERDVGKRRRELARDWGFYCQCPKCQLEVARLPEARLAAGE